MMEIFGKIRMPNAFNSDTKHRRDKGADDAAKTADHDHHEDIDDDAKVHGVMHGIARDLQRAASAARKTPTANTLVKSHF